MQRVQVQNAVAPDVPAPRDDGAAMAAALHRLAKLRATIYRDWSDGPSSLIAHANVDGAVPIPPSRARAYEQDAPDLSFTFDPTFTMEAPRPPELRGRFDCLAEMPPPADVVADVEIGAGAGAPVAYLLDLVRNLPKAPEVLVRPATVENPEHDDAPVLAVGAVAGMVPFEAEPPAKATPPHATPVAAEDEAEEFLAVGAIPGAVAFAFAHMDGGAKSVAVVPPAAGDDPVDDILAVGAFGWIDAPMPGAKVDAPPVAPAVLEEEFVDTLAVGAVAACLAFDTPALARAETTARAVKQEGETEEVFACGALSVATLLDLTPPAATFVPPPVVDLEEVALDTFLADACEALYAAAFDPTELYAWGASHLAGESDVAAHLAACETALWNLPRIVPCGEAFILHPNHEIAVKITRALRVRADTLRARAFTEQVNFGALCALDPHMPWFPSVEAPIGEGDETVDADTQLATWGMDDLATIITAPDRPLPILSEAELDALLATPAARDSHELDEDWQECPVWQETFWHDVDAYLQTVEGDEYRHEAVQHDADAPVVSDIEVREDVSAPIATHFWLPGDEADLAIDGEGTDMFLIGGGDAGVVLVEDGAIHSMRTGRGTRMGEVVVSWSTDAWSNIDAMTWTRVATLSGVSQVRVEQTVSHDRAVVVAGDLSGSALAYARVRLVEATEDGPREFPVMRIGGLEHDAGAWSLGPATAPAPHDDLRLFV
ncbi:MAG: hypothetical protein JNM47_11710 [Hyphomonadaceae bacterium]|nr:hypothetical protein [Hyphomonadaceae bacterium]